MASRTNNVQYSKRLATWITIIWAFLRLGAMIVSVIEPSIANAMVNLLGGLDAIMMVNIGFYSGNSATEKVVTSYFNSHRKTDEKEEEDSVG